MNDIDIRLAFKNDWQSQLPEAMRLLGDVADTLKTLRLPWCMVSGTLLGSVRHGGAIPWDHDMDISVFGLSDTIDRLSEELQRRKMRCIQQGRVRGVFYKITYGSSIPCVDLFYHELLNEFTIRSHGGATFLFTDVPVDSWFPYITGTFGNLLLPIPHVPEVYLDTLYPGWREYGMNENGQRVSMNKLREIGLC